MTEETTRIRMARSKAGHDKGSYYIIVREEPDYVYLADGISRTAGAPKKKNRKHIQIIEQIPAHVLEVFTTRDPLSDIEIKRSLQMYNRTVEQQEEAECQKRT